MIRTAIVTGGSGFIGRFLIRDLINSSEFALVINMDIRKPAKLEPGETFVQADLRGPVVPPVETIDPEGSWIFNLAAACREPGFENHEYFDINVRGAENTINMAESLGIRNIFFTSTMSSYGRMQLPTPETAMQYPETAYGVSKAIAERIHQVWLERNPDRRLVICRPGVIFGPGDKENIPRMISAVRKGYFLFPGDPNIVKGYGYVYGLVESIHFVRARGERLSIYNYAEKDCLTLEGMVKTIGDAFGEKGRIVKVPMWLLVMAAYLLQFSGKILGRKFAIHPVRVRKVAFPTNLRPQYLINAGFSFKYGLPEALRHWKNEAPSDFWLP
jgi:GlcNAc-P-P-Und epimerase